MAAKKGKTTRQYRQAKKAAKPAAKEAFPGKVQASRRDPKIKISAEDKLALREMRDTAKADLGKNAYLSKADYEAEQRAAREKFREKMRQEFGEYGGKKASAEEAAMKDTKAGGRKAPKVKNRVPAKGPSLVENGKVVSLDRAKQIMGKDFGKYGTLDEYQIEKNLEKEAKVAKPSVKKKSVKKAAAKKAAPSKPSVPATAKPATAGETPAKPAVKKPAAKKAAAERLAKAKAGADRALKTAPKNVTSDTRVTNRPTDASLRAKEDAYLKQTKERLAKKAASAPKPTASKPAAPKPKAEAPKPAAKVAKVAKQRSRTFRVAKFAAKKFPLVMVAGEVGSIAKGSTYKDLKEINRLKDKLGEKRMSAKEGATTQASNLANLATMGLVGKTRRQRMDELNAKIKKKEAATAKANKGLRYGKGGESLVPGTAAYKAGSTTRPTTPTTGAGGSTTTTRYTVKKGETLSAIAKSSGVSLSELRSANPTIMNKPKYKKGSMIWSGTKVNIPKKKQVNKCQ